MHVAIADVVSKNGPFCGLLVNAVPILLPSFWFFVLIIVNPQLSQVARKARRRMLKVRLDMFHALQRISRLGKKGHGAFRAFMARLRDACFIVNQDDVAEASNNDLSAAARYVTRRDFHFLVEI